MACNRHPLDRRCLVRKAEDGWGDGYQGRVFPEDGYVCRKCDTYVPESKSKRGKRANRRGRTESARIAKAIGGTNREVEGKPYDVTNDLYVIQSKKDNGLFSERHWKLLASIPREGGRVPVLIVKDAPGPGTKVRGYVVMDVKDFMDTSGVKA